MKTICYSPSDTNRIIAEYDGFMSLAAVQTHHGEDVKSVSMSEQSERLFVIEEPMSDDPDPGIDIDMDGDVFPVGLPAVTALPEAGEKRVDFEQGTVSDIRRLLAETIEAYVAASLAILTGNATPEERDTWSAKEKLARDWIDRQDPSARDMLSGMLSDIRAQAEGISLDDTEARATFQANRILGNAAAKYSILRAVEQNRDDAYAAADGCGDDRNCLLALLDTIQQEAEVRLEQFRSFMESEQ